MTNGEIHYLRFPITLDSNAAPDSVPLVSADEIFPAIDYDNVVSKIVPISGGSGISNAVMIVIARRKT